MSAKTFRRELMSVINKHSKEPGSNTPDFILAEYLIECLRTFDKTTRLRTEWYGEKYIKSVITESRNEFEKEIDEFTQHEHVFDSDGGSCRTCGKTVLDLLEEETTKNKITDTTKFSQIDIDKTFGDEKPGYPSRRNAELP